MTVLPPQSKLRMLCSGHAFTTAFKNAAISALDIRRHVKKLIAEIQSDDVAKRRLLDKE